MRSNLQFVVWQKREYVVARRLFIRQHSERKRKWKLEEARVVIFQFRKRRIEKVVFRAPSDDDLSWNIFSFSVTLLQGVGEGGKGNGGSEGIDCRFRSITTTKQTKEAFPWYGEKRNEF